MNILSNNNLQLALTVGISGAYDLMGTMDYEFDNVSNYSASCPDAESSVCNPYMISPGGIESGTDTPAYGILNASNSKVPLATFALSAFIYYNGQDLYSTIMNSNYVQMQNCLNLTSYYTNIESTPAQVGSFACSLLTGNNTYAIPNIFTSQSSDLSQTAIGNSLIASAMWNGNYITNGVSFESVIVSGAITGTINNSISSFIDPTVQTDPTFVNFMSAASIYSWTTSSPIALVHLKYDSTVPVLNSAHALAGISGIVGEVSVDNTQLYQAVDSTFGNIYLDHGYAGAILDIAALNQIKMH